MENPALDIADPLLINTELHQFDLLPAEPSPELASLSSTAHDDLIVLGDQPRVPGTTGDPLEPGPSWDNLGGPESPRVSVAKCAVFTHTPGERFTLGRQSDGVPPTTSDGHTPLIADPFY